MDGWMDGWKDGWILAILALEYNMYIMYILKNSRQNDCNGVIFVTYRLLNEPVVFYFILIDLDNKVIWYRYFFIL